MPDDQVRALMQAQHKTVMRDLMQGRYDERIIAFFAARGEHIAPPVHGAVPAATLPESPGPVMVLPPGGAPAAAVDAEAVPEPLPAPPADAVVAPVPPTAPEREGSGRVPVRVGPRRTTRPLETLRREGNKSGPVVVRAADGRRPPFVRHGTGPVAKISSADGVVVQRSVVVGNPTAPSRPARIRPPVPYVVTGGGHTEKPPRAETSASPPQRRRSPPRPRRALRRNLPGPPPPPGSPWPVPTTRASTK